MQKISSRHIIVSALFAMLIVLPAVSQDEKPAAISTSNGILIYLGNEIPKDFRYEVSRKEGKGNFSLIGTTSYPEDEKEMKSRVDSYDPMFPDLDKLGEKEISRIRRFAERNRTTDTIAMDNLPVMHLAFGTAFFDKDVKPGGSYIYNVRKVTGKDTQVWERQSNPASFPAKTDILKPLFSDKEESATQIMIKWFVSEQKRLNSFSVYRRVYGQGDFRLINAVKGYNASHDTVFLIAIDTTVRVPGFYQYYIKPFDIYGNNGPASDTVGAGTLGNAYNPVPDFLRATGKDKDHQVQISWGFTDKKYIRGIEIFRSSSFDKGFARIALLAASDTSYTDVVPVANQNYWYYLVIDGPLTKSTPSAKVSAMFRTAGEKPPAPAETGAKSVRGGVQVYWTYDEPYVKGFYVYRYNYNRSDYTQVSGLISARGSLYSFVDSVGPGQGGDVFRYAVRAVNDLDQMSDLSPSASASPGVKAIMSVPLNPRISATSNGIMLIWDDLRNAENALMGYKVYRRAGDEKSFSLMPNDTLRNDKNYYSDTTIVRGKNYQYEVAAIDYYGNESKLSQPVSISMGSSYLIPPVIKRAVSTTDGIMISWGQVTDNDVVSVKVYRSKPGDQPSVIATIPKETEQYLDKTTSKGELYIYEISLISSGNKESIRSGGVSVRR
jgi:fibronectin type 3 domain-containing protein